MPVLFGIILLFVLYVLYKLFIDGWLFKIILFVAGWAGLYIGMLKYIDGSGKTAIIIGENTTVSWAVLVPTIICVLALLCTKVYDE